MSQVNRNITRITTLTCVLIIKFKMFSTSKMHLKKTAKYPSVNSLISLTFIYLIIKNRPLTGDLLF